MCSSDLAGKHYSDAEDINYSFNDTGCYRFTLIAENINRCLDTADKYLCVEEDFHFFMPNCFTPNENNLNDTLIPRGTGWLEKNYLFEIYNRWGTRIFKTEKLTEGWDGSNTGELSPFDTFIWRVRITDTENFEHYLNGHVTILR